jgi:hypothetical protein
MSNVWLSVWLQGTARKSKRGRRDGEAIAASSLLVVPCRGVGAVVTLTRARQTAGCGGTSVVMAYLFIRGEGAIPIDLSHENRKSSLTRRAS